MCAHRWDSQKTGPDRTLRRGKPLLAAAASARSSAASIVASASAEGAVSRATAAVARASSASSSSTCAASCASSSCFLRSSYLHGGTWPLSPPAFDLHDRERLFLSYFPLISAQACKTMYTRSLPYNYLYRKSPALIIKPIHSRISEHQKLTSRT